MKGKNIFSNKKIRLISGMILLAVLVILPLSILFANPPATSQFGTGRADDAGYYMEYYLNGEWRLLKTPTHWEVNSSEISYCLNQPKDYPTGTQNYVQFNPTTRYSNRTLQGLYTILGHGYPNTDGGMSDKEARYGTANAIRAWLSESAGIGYDYMNVNNNQLRAVDGSPWTYNWVNGLLNLARNNNNYLEWSWYSATTTPSVVELNLQGNSYVGTFKVNGIFDNGTWGNYRYEIDYSKLPSGATLTNTSGDNYTITLPSNFDATSFTISDIIVSKSTNSKDNVYWYECVSGDYQPMVVVDFDVIREVRRDDIKLDVNLGGYVKIVKHGETDSVLLEDAVFEIYTQDGSNFNKIDTVTTNSQGQAISKLLEPGTYAVKEITAPDGYVLDNKLYRDYTVRANEVTQINLYNEKIEEPEGYFEIYKIGTGGRDDVLEGAVFAIYRQIPGGYEDVCQATTDSNGRIRLKLPVGTYDIEEITAPDGYVLDNTVRMGYEIEENRTKTIYISNEPIAPEEGYLKIVKYGETNSVLLEGAVFDIYKQEGNNFTTVDTITTNSQGEATSKKLPVGTYAIEEKTAPDGYIRKIEVLMDYNVENNKTTTAYVYNNKIVEPDPEEGYIKIIKHGETDNVLLEGAVFDIYKQEGNNVTTVVDRVITNSQGEVTSKLLPAGKYAIKEVTAPNGYVLNTETLMNCNVEDDRTITVHMYNEKIKPKEGYIKIVKYGETESVLLEDAVFEIYRQSDNVKVDTLTTNSNGEATSKVLPIGTYAIKEITAPNGYILDSKLYKDYTVEDNKTIVATFHNQLIPVEPDPELGYIKIVKYGETNNVLLKDAVFEIYRQSDNVKVDELKTDSNGEAISRILPAGTYIVKEITAPDGYVLDSTLYKNNVVKDDQTTTITIYNKLIPEPEPEPEPNPDTGR